eukprot:TRINITY_DN1763_c0_g1_i2.p1 TRINITY_DN1763_c0_g1~~TRINITY_DN1763_c0_g1_i2.p1  ORF type:complete len:370 (-),score=18.92 TRINITY_DN1763_c0_g1_i2:675-1784(-)
MCIRDRYQRRVRGFHPECYMLLQSWPASGTTTTPPSTDALRFRSWPAPSSGTSGHGGCVSVPSWTGRTSGGLGPGSGSSPGDLVLLSSSTAIPQSGPVFALSGDKPPRPPAWRTRPAPAILGPAKLCYVPADTRPSTRIDDANREELMAADALVLLSKALVLLSKESSYATGMEIEESSLIQVLPQQPRPTKRSRAKKQSAQTLGKRKTCFHCRNRLCRLKSYKHCSDPECPMTWCSSCFKDYKLLSCPICTQHYCRHDCDKCNRRIRSRLEQTAQSVPRDQPFPLLVEIPPEDNESDTVVMVSPMSCFPEAIRGKRPRTPDEIVTPEADDAHLSSDRASSMMVSPRPDSRVRRCRSSRRRVMPVPFPC